MGQNKIMEDNVTKRPASCCGIVTRALILVLTLVVTLGLVGIESFVKSRWTPGCFIAQSPSSYNDAAVDAARKLAEMPDKPMGLASDPPNDFSAVATGWHSKCNGIVDKEVIEAAVGPLPSDDDFFRDNAFSPSNYKMEEDPNTVTGNYYKNDTKCVFGSPTERRLLFGPTPQAGVCVPI